MWSSDFFYIYFHIEVATVDEVLDCHNNFLDSCLKDGMLTNPKLLKVKKLQPPFLNFK